VYILINEINLKSKKKKPTPKVYTGTGSCYDHRLGLMTKCECVRVKKLGKLENQVDDDGKYHGMVFLFIHFDSDIEKKP